MLSNFVSCEVRLYPFEVPHVHTPRRCCCVYLRMSLEGMYVLCVLSEILYIRTSYCQRSCTYVCTDVQVVRGLVCTDVLIVRGLVCTDVQIFRGLVCTHCQ